MKHLLSVMILYLTTAMFSMLSSQPFPCDGRLIVATNNNEATILSYQISIPFGPQFFSPMATYYNGSFDALGFNAKDNYIYGVQENTNAVVKLKRDNSFDTIGIVALADTLKAFAGDCTPDGLYFCYDNNLNQVLVFNVVDTFELVNRLDLYWDPEYENNGPFKTSIFDFAFDPNNPVIVYSFHGNYEHEALEPEEMRGYTLRINLDFADPNVGMVTPMSLIDKSQITHLGALLFSSNSQLFGYGTSDPGLNPIQDHFFSINPFSGVVSNTGTISTPATISDGCSCPYSFTFSHNAPQDGIFCNGDIKTFVFTINNNSYNDLTDLILTDTFPEGMIIEEVKSNINGIFEDWKGGGTRILTIEQFKVPAKSKIEIKIRVSAVDIPVGFTKNQAFLKNLPERFAGDLASDDPWTTGVQGDASTFSVAPRRLDDLSWEIVPPSDCLIANDAKVTITSPQFFPGQEYEIRLRNKIGWEESTWNVIIDNDQSFLLDSLIPGNYQLFYIRSSNDNCSLALKDTTIIIDPPNEQLMVMANTKGHVCEGETLQLNGEVFPDGKIRWTGPQLFVSPELNLILEDAKPALSGNYILEASYGYCERSEEVEVIVAPYIQAFISGKLEYCERDQLYLKADGNADTMQYQWTGPGDLVANQQVVNSSSIAPENAGYYEVIVDNGICQDTAGVEVDVLPSPTISLPTLVETDYCLPLILDPVITGDNQVAYSWLPEEGLSCSDCSTPEVLPVVLSNYRLTVVNDLLCTDSADVKIVLDKEKILLSPNVFRPNSSQNNDRFLLIPKCVVNQIKKIQIYDRWGNKVFSKQAIDHNNPEEFWDGYVGQNIGFPGVYIWKAEVELVDGSIQLISGDVTLLR